REEAEWESISVLLMMHGLKPLPLVKRTDMKDMFDFVVTLVIVKREEAEWESISVLLMMHGLKPLSLVKRTDMKDLIIFDKQSSQTMRENLKTMMEETSRQQNMIQELIETNKQLKNELQQQQSRAADQEQRANDLEQIMESVKSKIGEMEDESVNR
ncbi:hypothetical protein Celaphus_00012974, partial [Cervus elaphus hippelaphus]